jgi:predicted Fe-Mo cluster-binding NifX family protein
MKLAIPLANGKLAAHFGHCHVFALIEVAENEITNKQILLPLPNKHGVLPGWLHHLGADVIIAGGMGQRAIGMFSEKGIKVITGAPELEPEKLVNSYLDNTLITGTNVCDH